jgi:glyoxylase-like metal-dependent hydrolase (beta-lactamase superfamily II)
VQAIYRGAQVAVGYLVYQTAGGEALIVDAPYGSTASFLEIVRHARLTVKYIVNTHGHWDLIADNVPLASATGALLCAHAWDNARLANPGIAVEHSDEKVPPIKPSRPDKYINDGDILEIDDLRFLVIATPGHTPGSICLYEQKAQALFSGDIINKNAVGNTNMPGGNPQALERSLLRLAELPDQTKIFPAHGAATSIREVRWLLELANAG